MKGILLAGGSGTRLHPMTLAASKQLLPVYDKPMVYYPLSTLMLAGIRDIMVISTPEDLPQFRRLLGDGARLGVRFAYAEQPKPDGIAQAFLIGRDWIAGEPCALALGDNLIHGDHLSALLQRRRRPAGRRHRVRLSGARPRALRRGRRSTPTAARVDIVEKPAAPQSNWAVTGLYFYDRHVSDMRARDPALARAASWRSPTSTGSISRRARCTSSGFGRGCAWLDAGTPDSLLQAATFVQTIQSRTGHAGRLPGGSRVPHGLHRRRAAARAGAAARQDRARPGAAGTRRRAARLTMAGMKVERLAIPDVMLHRPAALRRCARLLLGDLQREAARARRASTRPSCRTTTPLARSRAWCAACTARSRRTSQGKLVRVRARRDLGCRGRFRRGSPTYGRHVAAVLSAENWAQLWVPAGLPARLLHARAGHRGDLQGHRRLRPGRRARRDLERSRSRAAAGRSPRPRRCCRTRTASCRACATWPRTGSPL